MRFVAPSEEHERDVWAYRAESLRIGGDTDGSAGIVNFADYAGWLARMRLLAGESAEKYGYYRTLVRLAYDGDALVGMLNVRLSEDVRVYPGHIGYHVRPSCRRRGYGSACAAEAVRLCALCGIAHPVICTLPDNPASQRVAENAGFTFAGEVTAPGGIRLYRYTL